MLAHCNYPHEYLNFVPRHIITDYSAVDEKIAIVKFGVKNGRGRGRIMLGFWSVLVEHYKKV